MLDVGWTEMLVIAIVMIVVTVPLLWWFWMNFRTKPYAAASATAG